MTVQNEAYSTNWHMFTTNVFPEALGYIHIAWRRKIVFFENPKVASTTMRHALIQYEWGVHKEMSFDDLSDRKYSPLLNILKVPSFQGLLGDPNVIKISLVRNPFSRLLSAYLDKIHLKDPSRISNLNPFMGRNLHDVSTDISFPQFVDAVCRQPVGLMDPHWRPQHAQLYAEHVNYSKIGKLENIAEFFDYLEAARPGISEYIRFKAPHQTQAETKLKEYYNPRIADKVIEKYSNDFEIFAYSTDL